MDAEKALRAHIRNLLLDYALTHLTKDYVVFTEEAVHNLLSGYLRQVPTTDPHALVLPEDPFATLTRTLGLASLEPYDQKWAADPEGLRCLKDNLAFPGKSKSERCWLEDDGEFCYERSIYRRVSPVLTTRAMRQTPRPVTRTFLDFLPASLSAFIESKSIKTIDAPHIQEPPPAKLDDALNLRPGIDAQTHGEMLTLLRSTAAISRPSPHHVNHHIETFLRGDFPPPIHTRPESPFIPLFPRTRLPGSKSSLAGHPHPSGLSSISDLPNAIAQVKMEDEVDLYKEHMVVVDGWQTYKSSVPSTPSPAPSQGESFDQIDELFLLSSPNTEPALIQVLMDAKMDEVEMPRTRKIGGARAKPEPLGGGKDLASFLLPLLPPLQPAPSIQVHASSPQPTSMVGAASESNVRDPDEPDYAASSAMADWNMEGLDTIIAKVCTDVHGQDAQDLILNERLDTKDGLLMEVPTLRPPTDHPPSALLPTTFQHLLAPPKPKQRTADIGPISECGRGGFLRKAKGIPGLNMELSWMPFKFGAKVPTHEEVAGVSSVSVRSGEGLECEWDLNDRELRGLLEGAGVDGFEGLEVQRKDHWEDLDLECVDGQDSVGGFSWTDDCEMLLTRRERRRLAGIVVEDGWMGAQEEAESIEEDREGIIEHPPGLESPGPRPGKRPRLQHDLGHPGDINDSGISLLPVGLCLDRTPSPRFVGEDGWEVDGDKENVQPADGFGSDEEYEAEFARYTIDRSYDDLLGDGKWGGFEGVSRDDADMEQLGFLPLSFDSHQALPSQPAYSVYSQAAQHSDVPATIADDQPLPCRTPAATLPAVGLPVFMDLRARDTAAQHSCPEHSPEELPSMLPNEPPASHTVPEDLFDRTTLRIPWPWPHASTPHRYLASLAVLQKRSLIRSLCAPQCAVDLVERESLFGADLILDPHTAVIFAPLLTLSSQCAALTAQLTEQSWNFARLLVVFEAFPASHAYKRNVAHRPGGMVVYPFSPPVVKAVRKLRRDLGIAEACGGKREAGGVWFAFARTVDEAAVFVRLFGDMAEGCDDTGGVMWDEREWLDGEVQEGEGDMAVVDGMNAFAAAVISSQIPLQEFLDLRAEERLDGFGPLVGVPRIELLNEVIKRRGEAMAVAFSSSQEVSMDVDEGGLYSGE